MVSKQDVSTSGFMTSLNSGASSTAKTGKPPKRSPLVLNETFLVIPIVKSEGHPFPDRIGVGRTKGTDLTLFESDISKYQGYFSQNGGSWFFTDPGSSNGTFARGERLTPMVTTPIEDNTEIHFGSGRYIFRTAAGFCDFLGR